MTIKSICIFTQSPLSKAPRVVKEANVYAKAGYDVTVYGLWGDLLTLESDIRLIRPEVIYKAGIDLLNWNGFEARLVRIKRRFRRELVKRFQVETRGALGYNFESYLNQLKSENADLYIGHEEMSMALAEKLIKIGKKVAFDFEDWHSRDLLPKDRAYRPIKLLEHLEAYVLNEAYNTYTTSKVMARAMADAYNAKAPQVIYNSFPHLERQSLKNIHKDRQDFERPSLYWFSQVISEGRGLELLLDALKHTKTPVQLHLRGNITATYRTFLKNNIADHVHLFIHDIVPYNELLSRIIEHDLGIAFEEGYPENKNLTISNKIFHYIQAGIAIIATQTAGQREIADLAPEAICVTENDAKIIATKIDQILSDPSLMAKMKTASWCAGGHGFAFEKETIKLLKFLPHS